MHEHKFFARSLTFTLLLTLFAAYATDARAQSERTINPEPNAATRAASLPSSTTAPSSQTRPATPLQPSLRTSQTQAVTPRLYTPSDSSDGSTPKPVADIVTPLPSPLLDPVFANREGLLVETLDGHVVLEQAADTGFNPASALKLVTALAALRNFGTDHRFATGVWTNGEFDEATGTLRGDLVFSGRDPSFCDAHVISIARELNAMGIRIVTGDLIVASGFTLDFNSSAQRSGDRVYDTLDAERRPSAATRAWQEAEAATRVTVGAQVTRADTPSVPSVAVMGAVYVDSVPAGARLLLTHSSSKLVDVLKVLLCYSNNFMAARLGDTMGGAAGLQRFLVGELGVNPDELRIASTSGLGVNRVTPRTMMRVYRALVAELAKSGRTPADILPVAGIDPGTLHKRYTTFNQRGSVIGKTGTLARTDGGASALVGQMKAANGETLFFVIFNQRGGVSGFRNHQDNLITRLQQERGGASPFTYTPQTLALHLGSTELQMKGDLTNGDEYEANPR